MYAVVDGQEQNLYKWVLNLIFSPDSKRLAYSAGVIEEYVEKFVVVDGIESKKYVTQDFYANFKISPLIFSPDSKHIAYAVEMGDKCLVVVDGKEGRHYDAIRKETIGGSDKWDKSLVFSPDGRIAYWAKRGNTWRIVVDGVESKEYWWYLPNAKLVFESPNLLHTVAFRDQEIFRVEIEIKEN
jgi:WD40 repeat protein